MEDKVIVTSMTRGITTLFVPSLRFRKIWARKGAKLPIEKSILREIIYEPGVENMFRKGVLYIDDMNFKIELGLEAEGTTEPTQTIFLDEKYMDRILKLMPISEMRSVVSKLSDVQRQELVDYASTQNSIQFDRADVIKKLCGVDILQVVSLNKQEEE